MWYLENYELDVKAVTQSIISQYPTKCRIFSIKFQSNFNQILRTKQTRVFLRHTVHYSKIVPQYSIMKISSLERVHPGPPPETETFQHKPYDNAPANPHHHSHPVLDAIINVAVASAYLNAQVDRAVEPLHITGVQYNILRVLKRVHPRGVSRTEILRHLIEKSVDVTRSIDGLIRLGFVERVRPEEDRRLSITIITDKGVAALDAVDPLFFSMMGDIGKKLTEEEFRELSRLCRKLSVEE
jgi:DNA-binding MarR family transcriptional regulator